MSFKNWKSIRKETMTDEEEVMNQIDEEIKELEEAEEELLKKEELEDFFIKIEKVEELEREIKDEISRDRLLERNLLREWELDYTTELAIFRELERKNQKELDKRKSKEMAKEVEVASPNIEKDVSKNRELSKEDASFLDKMKNFEQRKFLIKTKKKDATLDKDPDIMALTMNDGTFNIY